MCYYFGKHMLQQLKKRFAPRSFRDNQVKIVVCGDVRINVALRRRFLLKEDLFLQLIDINGGDGETRWAPQPGTMFTSPSFAKRRIASRTGVLLTLNSLAMTVSASRCPFCSSLEIIFFLIPE